MGNFKEIECLVSEAMGFDPSEIHTERKACHSTARKFIWYILHIEMKYSLREISEEYKRTTRAIMYGISDVTFGLSTQKYYKEIYSEIAHLRATKEEGK